MQRLFIVIALFSIFSCSTEIKVNADWEDITVVYGLLDINDTRHYVKINKAFLGEAAASDMARVRDSSEYNNIEVSIERYLDGELVQNSKIVLKDSTFTNKEQGDFYSPNHTIYFFDDNLDAKFEYRLNIDINGGKKTVYAVTPVIESFNVDGGSIFGNTLIKLGLVDGNGTYSEGLAFEWLSIPSGKAYQLIAVFHYEDHFKDSSVVPKSFEIPYGVQRSFDAKGGDDMEQNITGEGFFQQIQNNVPLVSEVANLNHRRFLYVTFDMIVGGDELNTYMEVNEPLTGILQDRPEYSNVENGIGIFSTRVRVTLKDGAGLTILKVLNSNSSIELHEGQYTGSLGFCTVGGAFACQ